VFVLIQSTCSFVAISFILPYFWHIEPFIVNLDTMHLSVLKIKEKNPCITQFLFERINSTQNTFNQILLQIYWQVYEKHYIWRARMKYDVHLNNLVSNRINT
jgi:hypothetical protein